MATNSTRAVVDWDAVRADYEAGVETVKALCERHGITPKTCINHVDRYGWMRRNKRHQIDRGSIIGRMFHLLDRQIAQLEQDMTRTGEKEVAVLGKLASTLEKLIDIDNVETAGKPKPGQAKDMMELRNKLAQRIEQLKRA